MLSKKSINKKGSYIVETSICLPIFMIAVIVMTSIILMFACIENANYIMANELRKASIEAKMSPTAALAPKRIRDEIYSSGGIVKSVQVTDYGYLAKRGGMDKLILLSMKMRMKCNNPLKIMSEGEYDLSLATRAYVGRERKMDALSAEDFMNDASEPVYIFPRSGKKYHDKNCTYVRAGYITTPLTMSIKSKYSGCSVCRSRKMNTGNIVCVFPRAGESYHRPGCKVLDRRYIEIEKRVALKRHYSPCSKCGG